AIDASPRERLVVRLVEPVPTELLREEPLDPRLSHDLWQLPVVAEHVGVPELVASLGERFLEESLAVDELTAERFAAGHVAVGLDPRAADGNPLPPLHGRPDALIEVGLVLLHRF